MFMTVLGLLCVLLGLHLSFHKDAIYLWATQSGWGVGTRFCQRARPLKPEPALLSYMSSERAAFIDGDFFSSTASILFVVFARASALEIQ